MTSRKHACSLEDDSEPKHPRREPTASSSSKPPPILKLDRDVLGVVMSYLERLEWAHTAQASKRFHLASRHMKSMGFTVANSHWMNFDLASLALSASSRHVTSLELYLSTPAEFVQLSTPISRMSHLKTLRLAFNWITEPTSTQLGDVHLPANLESLVLYGLSNAHDQAAVDTFIRAAGRCEKLRSFKCYLFDRSSLEPLQRLPALTHLNLLLPSNVCESIVNQLRAMKHLETLEIDGWLHKSKEETMIKQLLAPGHAFERLTDLGRNLPIGVLQHVRLPPTLTTLRVKDSGGPLPSPESLPNLAQLYWDNNRHRTWVPYEDKQKDDEHATMLDIARFTSVKTLHLIGRADMQSSLERLLSRMHQLTELTIDQLCVRSLAFLRPLTQLHTLTINLGIMVAFNEEVSHITRLSRLRKLHLSYFSRAAKISIRSAFPEAQIVFDM